MAPQPAHTIDHTPEYEQFIAALREYHAKRGTNFDPEPKVGQTPVDLLKLFRLIVEHGGYDKISEEKLAWRNMVNNLELYSSNEASAAYSLKLAYYKNLAAYEITTIYGKEPPPPEILEHISAKGGGLLTRTLENFGGHRGIVGRSTSGLPGSTGGSPFDTPTHGGADDLGRGGTPLLDAGTPLSGRASRGLREAPPQRVIFQPDTGSSRQTRHANAGGHGQTVHVAGTPVHGMAHGQTPFAMQHSQLPLPQQGFQQRGASLVYNPPGSDVFSTAVQNYEPRGPVPIMLQTVEGPATVPARYVQQLRLQRLEASGVSLAHFATRPPVLPGNEGPNIYVRCLGALRSGLPAEEAFALSHLVKISYERGDKYKFESFPGLAEGLLEKALQVGSLFYYDIHWTIAYDLDGTGADAGASNAAGTLDGVNGTPDILARIARLRPREDTLDCVQTEAFSDQLVLITEAALTLRNMVTLPENAYYLADFPPSRDFLCIVLNLPTREAVVELKHCALDIAEQLTPHLALGEDDPLYQTLLGQLDSADRGTVLAALRALGRIAMNTPQTNQLGRVPVDVLQRVGQWLLLNDDELMDACLDFLYQYTAVATNVARLLQAVRAEHLVSHLVRLLAHGARRSTKELVLVPERKRPATEEVLAVPADLLARLVATEEPERCYTWLRCFFEEDPDASITQIAIWQAYQSSFLQAVQQSGRTMLGAAEFIRNVTHVFHAAGAQIQKEQTPQGEVVQKFIIKGIRPRVRPISPPESSNGNSSSLASSSSVNVSGWREYFPCQWKASPPRNSQQQQEGQPQARPRHKPCGVFFASAEMLYAHILKEHMHETVDADGKVANKRRDCRCLWTGCYRYPTATEMALADFMRHIKTHAVAAEQERKRPSSAQDQQPQPSQPQQGGDSSDAQQTAVSSSTPNSPEQTQAHHRHRSSVTNGDLAAVSGMPPLVNGAGAGGVLGATLATSGPIGSTAGGAAGAGGAGGIAGNGAATSTSGSAGSAVVAAGGGPGSPANKRQKRSYVVPATTITVAYEDTTTMRDERNPNLPPQAAGIPLSAVLVLRNIARNADKADKAAADKTNKMSGGASESAGRTSATVASLESGGWNERLFRPMLPRLYEIMTENRALSSYIASLFQLIGEEA